MTLGSMDLEKLTAIGGKLGLKGPELKEFLDRERDRWDREEANRKREQEEDRS